MKNIIKLAFFLGLNFFGCVAMDEEETSKESERTDFEYINEKEDLGFDIFDEGKLKASMHSLLE